MLYWETVCKTVRPMLYVVCVSLSVCLSVSHTLVYYGQTIEWIKMKLNWHAGSCLGPAPATLC